MGIVAPYAAAVEASAVEASEGVTAVEVGQQVFLRARLAGDRKRCAVVAAHAAARFDGSLEGGLQAGHLLVARQARLLE